MDLSLCEVISAGFLTMIQKIICFKKKEKEKGKKRRKIYIFPKTSTLITEIGDS